MFYTCRVVRILNLRQQSFGIILCICNNILIIYYYSIYYYLIVVSKTFLTETCSHFLVWVFDLTKPDHDLIHSDPLKPI